MLLASLIAGFRYAVTVPPELSVELDDPHGLARRRTRLSRRRQTCGPRRTGDGAAAGAPAVARRPLWIRHRRRAFDLRFHGRRRRCWMACSSATGNSRSPAAMCRSRIRSCSGPRAWRPFCCVAYGFADVERWALQTATRTAGLGAALAAIVLLVKIADRANAARAAAREFRRATRARRRSGWACSSASRITTRFTERHSPWRASASQRRPPQERARRSEP